MGEGGDAHRDIPLDIASADDNAAGDILREDVYNGRFNGGDSQGYTPQRTNDFGTAPRFVPGTMYMAAGDGTLVQMDSSKYPHLSGDMSRMHRGHDQTLSYERNLRQFQEINYRLDYLERRVAYLEGMLGNGRTPPYYDRSPTLPPYMHDGCFGTGDSHIPRIPRDPRFGHNPILQGHRQETTIVDTPGANVTTHRTETGHHAGHHPHDQYQPGLLEQAQAFVAATGGVVNIAQAINLIRNGGASSFLLGSRGTHMGGNLFFDRSAGLPYDYMSQGYHLGNRGIYDQTYGHNPYDMYGIPQNQETTVVDTPGGTVVTNRSGTGPLARSAPGQETMMEKAQAFVAFTGGIINIGQAVNLMRNGGSDRMMNIASGFNGNNRGLTQYQMQDYFEAQADLTHPNWRVRQAAQRRLNGYRNLGLG